MDELIQHFKNLEEDETLKRIDDAYNRGWNDAMNNPEVKNALDRMKPMKPERRLDGWNCPICEMFQTHEWEVDQPPFCWNCGQALDWSEE